MVNVNLIYKYVLAAGPKMLTRIRIQSNIWSGSLKKELNVNIEFRGLKKELKLKYWVQGPQGRT